MIDSYRFIRGLYLVLSALSREAWRGCGLSLLTLWTESKRLSPLATFSLVAAFDCPERAPVYPFHCCPCSTGGHDPRNRNGSKRGGGRQRGDYGHRYRDQPGDSGDQQFHRRLPGDGSDGCSLAASIGIAWVSRVRANEHHAER